MNTKREQMNEADLQISYANEMARLERVVGATNLLIEMTEAAEASTFEVYEDVKLQTEAAKKGKRKK